MGAQWSEEGERSMYMNWSICSVGVRCERKELSKRNALNVQEESLRVHMYIALLQQKQQ